MEINKFKKLKNGKYKIFYEDGDMIVYEDVILQNDLLLNKNIDLKKISKIMKDNLFYEAYNLSLKYITIKLRTKKEIQNYLKKKDFDNELIDRVIIELENKGFINEMQYVKAYVNDKINLSYDGPFKIKKDLMKLNVKEENIDSYLSCIDNNVWITKINSIVEKKVKLNKKLSLNMFKRKASNDLYMLGYNKEDVIESLNNVDFDDNNLYEKEYEKVYKKYCTKYKDKELEYKIKSYMLSKGFYV